MTPVDERARANLRRALIARRMEIVTLGRRASGMDPGHSGFRMARRHLAGETRMDLDTIDTYARILGVDPGWLAFGEGPPR